MKKIAITGGIASGKSAVCSEIENLGYKVIYTDKINSELLNDAEYQKKLSAIFPLAVKNNIVDKKLIRQEILLDDKKRLALNALAHSEIKLRVDNLIKNINAKAIFVEIPLIVESGMKDYFDEIWCVIANFDTKIERIIKRDNISA
ncbi:MAG: dephospho-CoA kinase, partial [Clostridia bacterium]|nr:dephospho-CoA kinase [Clostridia bacterium]